MYYGLGCFIAFLTRIIFFIYGFVESKSLCAKNFEKIGLYYNFYNGEYSTEKKSGCRKFFIGLIFLVIDTLLSWVSVAYDIFVIIKHISNKLDTPENVKELRFKLNNTNLSRDEVLEIAKQISKYLGIKREFVADELGVENDSEDELNEDSNIYIIPTDKYSHAEVYIEDNYLYYDGHSDDWLYEWDEKCEFKIDGTKVFERMIENSHQSAGFDKEIDVKDGVVQKSDIIEREKDNKFYNADEKIERYSKEVKWHMLYNDYVRLFVLYKYLEFDSFKRFARRLEQKYKLGKLQIDKICKKYGISLKKENSGDIRGYSIDYKSMDDDDKRSKFSKEYNKLPKSVMDCLRGYETILEEINKYLEEGKKDKKNGNNELNKIKVNEQYDEDGYDENGFDDRGFDREGFDKDGYDGRGYDKDGYDRKGFDKNGFDEKGINKETKTEYDSYGYNKDGYSEKGFDKNGIHKVTGKKYDEDGYDRYGFDKRGINKETGTAYSKLGYDKNWFNEKGIHKLTGTKYDRDGYDSYGFDKDGFDREGYNTNGYKDGYDRKGFDVYGFNKDGLHKDTKKRTDKNGKTREDLIEEFEKEKNNRKGGNINGSKKKTYYGIGYDEFGFDENGIHKVTGTEYDEEGYNKKGVHKSYYEKGEKGNTKKDKKQTS